MGGMGRKRRMYIFPFLSFIPFFSLVILRFAKFQFAGTPENALFFLQNGFPDFFLC